MDQEALRDGDLERALNGLKKIFEENKDSPEKGVLFILSALNSAGWNNEKDLQDLVKKAEERYLTHKT